MADSVAVETNSVGTESTEQSVAKTTEEVLKMSGKDELKFGVLIGLIQVGQVSNKNVVDTVLSLLVGGQFEPENNFIISDPENVIHMLKLMDSCSTTLQAEIWSHCTAILRKSTRNLQACTEIGLIEKILLRMSNVDDMLADLMVDLLGVLASYSITVKELRILFGLLKANSHNKWPRHSTKLLRVLRQMPQRHGPDEFFSFPGKKGSAIALPPLKGWPYQNGWTFHCWFRMDPVTGVNIDREKPYLFCFRTSKAIGYSGHFLGNALVITSMKVKGKGFQHCVKYDFKPREWYMVTIVFIYNRWSKSELNCYVDGQLASHTEMSWLVNTNDPFDKCYLGSSHDMDADTMFCGQMSSVYLFSEALTANQVAALELLGPGYKSQLKFENESNTLLSEPAKRVLYDGKLTSAIIFMYTPVACDSQLCLESSPKGNPSYFVHNPHALMLNEVKAVITHSIHSTLHSIGGIQVLFPLFGQLDLVQEMGSDQTEMVDYSICATLMKLLCDLLESSVTIQQQLLQNKGFLVISYLLEKSSRQHVTEEVLDAFLVLTKYLVSLPAGGPLLKHLFDHILFNPALWIYSPVNVQKKLYLYLSSDFINDAQIYNSIRRVSSVLQTMHTLIFYYWVANPANRSGINPKGVEGPRPSKEEILELRALMLQYIRQLVLRGSGVQDDELQSIINFLATVHEDDNVLDVLDLLVQLMSEHPASMVPAFDRKGGIKMVFKLLASSSETIRIQSLKLLGFFLMRSTHKRKHEAMTPHNLFSLITERLMLNSSHITMGTYNCLFEIMTERMSNEIIIDRHEEPDSTYKLENPLILKVIANLIRQSRQSNLLMDVKKLFLSDLTVLCNNNKENRRTVLQMSVWQDWLFSMAYIYPRNDDEQNITEMVMALFRMLLHHAIKFEYGGWRVWIDTLAILHSKVSYEDFRIHMARVYQQYERMQVSNISDPSIRRQHPVSTIYGLSTQNGTRMPTQNKGAHVTELKETNNQGTQFNSQAVEPSSDDAPASEKDGAVSGSGAAETKEGLNGSVEKYVHEVVEEVVAKLQQENDVQNGAEKLPDDKTGDVGSKPEDESNHVGASGDASDRPGPSEPQSLAEAEASKMESDLTGMYNRSTSTASDDQDRSGVARPTNVPYEKQVSTGTPSRQIFSPGPRAPPFRIPEFRWSYLHQKLLSDLLYSLEQDIQVWKTHTTKTVIDYVNASENHVFVVNVTHMISQLADILITSCGGLLPLLAAATSPTGEIEMLEPNQGLSIEQAVSFLQRLINMTDILVFASSLNFSELEQEKTMNSGGILRQCLRLVCTCAVRNCLECRHRQQMQRLSMTPGQQGLADRPDPIQALITGAQPSSKNIVEKLGTQMSPVRDPEKLLQDMDINRLRAVVYRDVEETKQAQFLALAIVYFVSVLMVSKYRDILEPVSSGGGSESNARRSVGGTPVSGSAAHRSQSQEKRRDLTSRIDPRRPLDSSNTEAMASEDDCSILSQMYSGGLGACKQIADGSVQEDGVDDQETSDDTKEEIGAAVDGDKAPSDSEEDVNLAAEQTEAATAEEEGTPVAEAQGSDSVEDQGKKGLDKDVSISNSDEETGEYDDATEAQVGESREESDQNTETKTAEEETKVPELDHPVFEQEPVSLYDPSYPPVENGNDGEPSSRVESSMPRSVTPDMIDESLEPGERGEGAIASISMHSEGREASASAINSEAIDLSHEIPGPVQITQHAWQNDRGSLTDRLERALGPVAPLLREIFVDFAPFLSKTLLGSHGQELLIGGLVTLKQSTSVVELVMLLCSQEWQNSLQKHAGLAFIELVNEGRLLAHATRDHVVRVANEAEFILNRMRADDVQKHAEFEGLCAQSMLERKDEEKLCDHLITSARRRDHVIASKQRDKVLNIMANKHGAWGDTSEERREFWKLDSWEDDSRRRRRLVKNPLGSTHPEAALRAAIEHGATEDAINAAREEFHQHVAASQKAQQHVQDTSEEDLSQLDERELDAEFAGPVALSTPCKLVSPGYTVSGTLSITKTELYFEMDDDDPKNKKLDPKVALYIDYLHGKWHFNEIRAIFSRRYLLQNVAIEIFMASRTAVMFAFQDFATVKKVVNALPRVGVGVKYGLPQTRRVSLALPKQIFKMSNMMQKWQRREISNFDYLMYLNTVAGRTYCDLNQYPVYPWVIVNYESNELDLNLASNYRDLSKPIGALNPTRRSFFEERYTTWDNNEIPPFHYGTHYSTAAFTLNWLIRVEPFTTFFLQLQGGKFDHANRTFHSVLQAWKNCQRDTSDVKELIPEFYYLPDMFVNTNSYNLGTNEENQNINSVVLPPWAKTPEDFVRIMRMALESEIVSIQLHQWIDLIFGYKQKGPEAIRATNVFYYLTYEGSLNLESITDPVLREALENQIHSFGQTPSQLLTEPHPPRSSPMNLSPMMFTAVPEDVCMIMKFLSNSPVTHISANTHPAVPLPAVITITCNHNFAVNKWNHTAASAQVPSPSYAEKPEQPPQLPLAMDQLLVFGTGLHRRNLGDNFDQRMKMMHSSFITTADNRFILAVGFWDKSYRVFSTDSGRVCQTIYGHYDVVTCIARSECNISQDCYIVTGSKDCTVMVWHWNAKQQSILGDNGSFDNATPKATLTGHKTEVTCITVSAELGIVVSGSMDGPVLIHSNTGDLLRSLDSPNPDTFHSPKLLTLNREGYIIVNYDKGGLCAFGINGKTMRHITHNDTLQCMIMSRDGQYLIMAGDNGIVEVWRTHDLNVLYTYPTCDSSVRSLALSHDQRFLMAGLATGCLIVFNIDFNKWHHEYQEKYQ